MEIERKFLVKDGWKTDAGKAYAQGYLCLDQACTVRVRIAGDEAFLTIKGETSGVSRPEFQYEIPTEEAKELIKLCVGPRIEKTRHFHILGGKTWEVDEFHGDNQGLIVAEIELDYENEPFEKPQWLGEEVSHDPRYYNANLVTTPFKNWG